jgi:hypothetical protein
MQKTMENQSDSTEFDDLVTRRDLRLRAATVKTARLILIRPPRRPQPGTTI